MPDPRKLDPKSRAALLGCIKTKNKKWSSSHRGKKVPASVIRRHFSSCSQAVGVEESTTVRGRIEDYSDIRFIELLEELGFDMNEIENV
jgi:hypothetical protein